MCIRKIFFCMLVCLIIASPAYGSEKTVKLSSIVDYSPFLFQKDSKKSVSNEIIRPDSDSKTLQGYAWDIVRESYHNQGYVINLTVAPWARSLSLMEMHKVDLIIAATYTKSRTEKYYFSREEVHKIQIVIYVSKDIAIEWKGLESMYGKKIAVVRGFTYGDKFEAATLIKKQEIGLQKQGFALIDKKRVLGFVGMSTINDYYLKEHGISSKYKKLPRFDFNTEYMAGMKNNPKVIRLLDVYDAGKRTITQNGTLDKIKAKWGVTD